jgi:neutral ceramidase
MRKGVIDTGSLAGTAATSKDTGPIDFRFSLLLLGDIAISGVKGKVLSSNATRLKRDSPYAGTIMVTLTN